MPIMRSRRHRARPRSRLQVRSGGLIYLTVTAIIVAGTIYTQANLLFWALGLMIGGLVVSLLLSWQLLRHVQVQRVLPAHGVAGTPMVIRYQLTNYSWLPVFSLTLLETWGRGLTGWKDEGPVASRPPMLKGRPCGWVLHVGPRQTIQAEAPCWPLRRGVLRFERIVLTTGFPFGIVHKVVSIEQPAETLVYPHLYRINRRMVFALSGHDTSGRKQRERAGGMGDFFGLRPYRVGDSLKMIDWKRTARTGEMVSREMTLPDPPHIMVLLDLNRPAASAVVRDDRGRPTHQTNGHAAGRGDADAGGRADRPTPTNPIALDYSVLIERAISLAASLVCEAHFHGHKVGLAVRGAACPTFPIHHSLPHRTRMLEALARLSLTPAGDDDLPAALPATPSVIVWLGYGEQVLQDPRGGATHLLGAADMERYVREFEGGPGALLLASQGRQVSRREEVGMS